MSDWWEQPYKGAPMIQVPGFPRPLYPPDAAEEGKKPSVKGPDVEAYKRVAWRLRRWPGPASGFDQAFSNLFSHGQGPNVIDTGIAGVQRQARIEPDSGWVGQATFNMMRSVLIPEGCPGPGNPGEYAMDAYAQSLIVDAWEMFGGKEPEQKPPPTQRQLALEKAAGELGYKESPAGSNKTKYGEWYGANYSPWCAMFVTWAYETSGDSPSFAKGIRYAYVPYIVSDAYARRNGLSVTSAPVPGDLVCYDWVGDGVFDHVGLFERWTDGDIIFDAIEGNTSTSSDSDGGQVMRRSRNRRAQTTVFVRAVD